MTPLTTVLIVDDEPAVRDLMARWVTALGLRPQTAANADEALASLRVHHYDLAVIDVMMPGHDGLWLANEVQRDHPNTAVVIATAYTDLLDADAQQRPIADFLIKPFQRERFALAVDRGRQWRKQALEEVHWHAVLSLELRDRAQQFSTTVSERAVRGRQRNGRAPRARGRTDRRHRRRTPSASRATRSRSRARWGSKRSSARRSSTRRGFTTSARPPCPTRCSRSRVR